MYKMFHFKKTLVNEFVVKRILIHKTLMIILMNEKRYSTWEVRFTQISLSKISTANSSR